MEAYTGFAAVYDTFMDNVPYEEWCGYIKSLLTEQGVKEGLVLDLGCGTGSLTELLAAAGYDMIGVDASEEMLELAYEKKAVSGSDILYLCQDMRELELYGTVEAVISVCDCMNYILEYEDLVQVFRLVNNYLDPGGVFIFDLNTEYKYETVMGDRVIAEDREDAAFIWEARLCCWRARAFSSICRSARLHRTPRPHRHRRQGRSLRGIPVPSAGTGTPIVSEKSSVSPLGYLVCACRSCEGDAPAGCTRPLWCGTHFCLPFRAAGRQYQSVTYLCARSAP